ncbi:IclR family transcriptional regulator [Bradyrhizobium cenepequi]|uniref:IclR family transcriptional regulator n=1 Tax=Bradyrhizobium cenepequi TaxID=2821403 RepID=UPI001CE31952|nr:IclR family transcriptional regulator [Bradyrhizobium cenepequi]MCA6105997.1 IclR family transcriptional regulator [Bradyrhizobium cenepequi]
MKPASRGIQSIEVGGQLLRVLARSGEPMMLRDLAREAGMAPAKAHPYLVSFSRIGLIEQDETTGRYEIGALALELGLISLRRLSAVRIATSKIRTLANTIDHAVSLAVWGSYGPTVVQIEEPSHPVHIAMRVGSVMALLETATGRAFAAFLPSKTINAALDSALDRFGVGYNPKRATKGAKVSEMLATVRKHGLARALGDPLPGVNALAAPVFDHAGHIALVITAMGPEATFDAGWDSAIAKALCECAGGISKRLGHGNRVGDGDDTTKPK